MDPKAFQYVQPPTLVDVAVWIPSYLTKTDQRSLIALVSTDLRKGARYGPLWITRPWELYRRRKWGFGTLSTGRSTSHDRASPMIFFRLRGLSCLLLIDGSLTLWPQHGANTSAFDLRPQRRHSPPYKNHDRRPIRYSNQPNCLCSGVTYLVAPSCVSTSYTGIWRAGSGANWSRVFRDIMRRPSISAPSHLISASRLSPGLPRLHGRRLPLWLLCGRSD
jgi:hypothetical protein